ncbi:polar amino acid transport system permease protein [Nocardioides luteus]|uniref:Amino acid ABC transporter permease n=1 Tax=Nocardioides luteus TaxID=1844 RepID=A0ABQ5SXX0_9ACTN|nr:amino acid ABC transporter permease [Nocardioides luteus]MDR7312622.1 polar amino acid transport system permease protein [Nocardioides luteus]GGR46376.1 amino acid ABC transporter permease [Nocardioides luteus]GLJ68870.1 amino acid ABC transporter permease [Nocardioides luteus]
MAVDTALANPTTARPDAAIARPRFRPGRLAAVVVLVAATVLVLVWAATNPRFEWGVVGDLMFDPSVMAGLGMTLLLTVVCMALGTALGTAAAAGQLSDFGPVRWSCQIYVGLLRGVPPLVQLIFWFNLAYLVPRLSIGLPGADPVASWSVNELITPLTAAIIGLSLHESAYMAEIIRAGIMSVDSGQRDAARAMGYSRHQTFWKIVVPQAMRVIVPPSGSQFIALLKGTSLVSVITLTDLLYSVQIIYGRTYQVVPLLLVAVIWYLIVVTLLTLVQRRIERRLGRGYDRTTSARVRARSLEGDPA